MADEVKTEDKKPETSLEEMTLEQLRVRVEELRTMKSSLPAIQKKERKEKSKVKVSREEEEAVL